MARVKTYVHGGHISSLGAFRHCIVLNRLAVHISWASAALVHMASNHVHPHAGCTAGPTRPMGYVQFHACCAMLYPIGFSLSHTTSHLQVACLLMHCVHIGLLFPDLAEPGHQGTADSTAEVLRAHGHDHDLQLSHDPPASSP